ncbi:MAG: hypothetical protein U0556_13100 [Dehalococcoidia bacterium]
MIQDGTPAGWPAVEGAIAIGDPAAPVAVCALTSDALLSALAALPGVAIAGVVQTANTGIERMIENITANPAIRFLLLCGKDSKLFGVGQTIVALFERGVGADGAIVGAPGYQPVLHNLPRERIEAFRRQVELVDWTGETDLALLGKKVAELVARTPGRFAEGAAAAAMRPTFQPIRPGGEGEPDVYDPLGYFVITLDRAAGEMVVRHYQTDHTPAHELRAKSGRSVLGALLRDGLVSQLSHAGYLGRELANAETALRLGLRFDQDRPLRQAETPGPSTPGGMTYAEVRRSGELLTTTAIKGQTTLAVIVTGVEDDVVHGVVAEPVEPDPQRTFRRTGQSMRVVRMPGSRIMMGGPDDLVPDAVLRVQGILRGEDRINAALLQVLTKQATIV